MKAQVAFSAVLAKVKRHTGFDTREGKETIYDSSCPVDRVAQLSSNAQPA
jgi:hypothetical protein